MLPSSKFGNPLHLEATPGSPREPIFKQTFDAFHTAELLPYLRHRGKRYLLTAGLLTSTCVLFTTASAMQQGFLVAVVEDCCADQPDAHIQTLDRYPFIFERTRLGLLAEQHATWLGALQRLDEV